MSRGYYYSTLYLSVGDLLQESFITLALLLIHLQNLGHVRVLGELEGRKLDIAGS